MSTVPWLVHFFQRDSAIDAKQLVPAMEFLDQLPPKVVAEFLAVIDAVAEAPPPAFSGGGKWEAMHGAMAGFFEARVTGVGMNHRLFCILERNADDLGGSSVVVIDGPVEAEAVGSQPEGLSACATDAGRIPGEPHGPAVGGSTSGACARNQFKIECVGDRSQRSNGWIRAVDAEEPSDCLGC